MGMDNMHAHRFVGPARGQSLVELAISLPLVVALMAGVIDFGWVLYGHVQVAAASGAGARAGAAFAGDLTRTLAANDSAREQAIRNAIYNPSVSPSTTSMGMLNTSAPNFDVATDVQISYPDGDPADPLNTTRVGQDMVVSVSYRQPIWFQVLPGSSSGTFLVSTSTTVRVQ